MPRLKYAPKILLFFTLLVWSVNAEAGQPDIFTTSSRKLARELSDEVHFFADSTCSGREFGTGGATGAAFYIHKQLSLAGYDTQYQRFSAESRIGRNVIAVSPGNFKQYIVIGAYLDGLGEIGGVRYPGADSNASGLSAMLALARHFSEIPEGDTGLIFVAFDGHSADLTGSRCFLESYGVKYRFSLMVCLDTIGSSLAPTLSERPEYLIVLGGAGQSEALEWANRTVGLHLSYDYYGNAGFTELFYRRAGDQKWFIDKGIPSVMFTSGITLHTNKASDSADRLDYPLMVKRLRLIAGWLDGQIHK